MIFHFFVVDRIIILVTYITKDYKDYCKNIIDMEKTSALFKCHTTTLYNWIVKDMNKTKRKDREKLYGDDLHKFIVNFTIKNVTSTLRQIRYAIKQKYKISPSLTYIFNVLKNNDITRKRLVKKYFLAKRKNIERDLLKQFYKNVQKYNYKRIICIDEPAVYINMSPLRIVRNIYLLLFVFPFYIIITK